MKTKEELNALKEEIEALNRKLADMTEDEMKQVSGGIWPHDEHVLAVSFDSPRIILEIQF